jgi:hypothetical protein
MEGDTVDTVDVFAPQEVLRVGLSNVECLGKTGRSQIRSSPSTHVQSTKGVSTGNLTGDDEVVLAEIGGTLLGMRRPFRHVLNSDLSSFIDTDTVDICGLNEQTTVDLDTVSGFAVPFSKTILHRGEFGQLTHPIGEDTECFDITVLIELRGITTSLSGIDDTSVVVPESGELTRVVVG